MDKKDISRVNYQGCSVLYFDDDPGLTEQHHVADCDINNIMAKFAPQVLNSFSPGSYGDFSELPDYHTALSTVRRIDDMFMDVPANVRAAFDNDPAKFLAAFEDESSRQKLVDLGLIDDLGQSLTSPQDSLNAAESSEPLSST
jgi:hypothetical protein